MQIVLSADNQTLGEVVVTGIQKMDKRLFTGATTKLDANTAKLDGVADVSRALEGRAAGVSVQNVSGTFGTAEDPCAWCYFHLWYIKPSVGG